MTIKDKLKILSLEIVVCSLVFALGFYLGIGEGFTRTLNMFGY